MTDSDDKDQRHRCGDCEKRGISAHFEHDEEARELVCPSCGVRVSTRSTAYWTWGLVILGFFVIVTIEHLLCSP